MKPGDLTTLGLRGRAHAPSVGLPLSQVGPREYGLPSVLAVVLLLVLSLTGSAMSASVVPINTAEAIVEPFWDSQLSGFKHWTVDPGAGHGLNVQQSWCWVTFGWSKVPEVGPALRMSREFGVDVSGYDLLLVSVMAPRGAIVHIRAATDAGPRTVAAPPATDTKAELELALDGATRLDSLVLEVHPAADGLAAGWFNWIGLQNSELLPGHLSQWQRFDASWPDHLVPENHEPDFVPRYGLLVSADELDALRAHHDSVLRVGDGESPFVRAAARAQGIVPENMIGEYACFWGDTRYNRVREHGRTIFGRGVDAAVAGLLTRDRELLRLAARYAMSIAMCDHWDDSFISRFPGGNWEHRAFVQSQCAHDVALILDLAGEMFTRTGRDFLLRRLAEEATGTTNFVSWKFDYIFRNNQLAWFTPGRMAAYLVMEQEWPRVAPYTDIAYRDLLTNLDNAILPDGGFVEGPTYFNTVGNNACRSLHYYARFRDADAFTLIPDVLRRTGDFIGAVTSTTPEVDVIPICDAGTRMDHDTLAMMAALLPESPWVAMFQKAVARSGGQPSGLLSWVVRERIPSDVRPVSPFVRLPEMGVIASTRQFGAHTVKLLLMGNRAGAGHTHEDKGSFVLEFAGQVFAMDPGTCSYSNPLSSLYKQCQRHNMLVPTGTPERPHPKSPLPVDVKPEGEGDGTAFRAHADLTPGWDGYYRKWTRSWTSADPSRLVTRDEYELEKGDAVEFYWQTELPVEVRGGTVVITGDRGTVTLVVPEDCTARVDDLPLVDGTQHRIVFRREAVSGSVEVSAFLQTEP